MLYMFPLVIHVILNHYFIEWRSIHVITSQISWYYIMNANLQSYMENRMIISVSKIQSIHKSIILIDIFVFVLSESFIVNDLSKSLVFLIRKDLIASSKYLRIFIPSIRLYFSFLRRINEYVKSRISIVSMRLSLRIVWYH